MSGNNPDYMRAYRKARPLVRDRALKVANARNRALTELARRHAREYADLLTQARAELGVDERQAGRPPHPGRK